MAIPVMNQVAPVTPDNSEELHVPDMIFKGQQAGLQGLAAFAEMNDNKKKLELSFQKLAQDESLKEEQFSLKKQELDQEYELKKAMVPYAQRLSEAQAAHWNSFAGVGTTTKENALMQEKNVADRITMFQTDLGKSKALEASPTMAGWKDYQTLFERYGTQNIPAIKQQLGMLHEKYKAVEVPLKFYGGYEEPGKDKDGKEIKVWKGGAEVKLTPGEIMARLYDPKTSETMKSALRANKFMGEATTSSGAKSNMVPGPTVNSWMGESKGIDLNKHGEPLPPMSSVSKGIAAQMGGQPEDKHARAIRWAQEHPNSPYSAAILNGQ